MDEHEMTFNHPITIRYPECIALRLLAQSELTRRLDEWGALEREARFEYFRTALLPFVDGVSYVKV